MNNIQFIITLAVLSLGVMITRFLPFIIFRKADRLPKIVEYLGKVLPAAMMGLLVVYCFKDYDFLSLSSIAPALIASAGVVAVHLWKRNTVFSIALGTVLYMILIRVII